MKGNEDISSTYMQCCCRQPRKVILCNEFTNGILKLYCAILPHKYTEGHSLDQGISGHFDCLSMHVQRSNRVLRLWCLLKNLLPPSNESSMLIYLFVALQPHCHLRKHILAVCCMV